MFKKNIFGFLVSFCITLTILSSIKPDILSQNKEKTTKWPEPKFEHITVKDGLPDNSVWCMLYYRISNPAENHYTFNVKEKPVTVRLILALNAELCNLLSFDSRPPWRINGHSEDEFTFIQNRTITVAKNHTISNRNDIVLRIIYNVTIDGVTINKIFLRKI